MCFIGSEIFLTPKYVGTLFVFGSESFFWVQTILPNFVGWFKKKEDKIQLEPNKRHMFILTRLWKCAFCYCLQKYRLNLVDQTFYHPRHGKSHLSQKKVTMECHHFSMAIWNEGDRQNGLKLGRIFIMAPFNWTGLLYKTVL